MEKAKTYFMQRCQVDRSFEVVQIEPHSFPLIKHRSYSKTLQNLSQLKRQENSGIFRLDTSKGVTPEMLEGSKIIAKHAVRHHSHSRLVSCKNLPTGTPVVGVSFKCTETPWERPSDLQKKQDRPKRVVVTKRLPKSSPKKDMRDQVFLEFLSRLRLSNALQLTGTEFRYFKFYIAKGNNSGLVKRALKRRWWWVGTDSMKTANFIWTSLKHQKAFLLLPRCDQPNFHITEEFSSAIPKRNRQQSCEEQVNLGFNGILNSMQFNLLQPKSLDNTFTKVYNRLSNNKQLCSKKRLFRNLQSYCDNRGLDVFTKVPLTFHVSNHGQDRAFASFEAVYKHRKENGLNNLWIIKPGESSNRGRGIRVTSSMQEIREIVCYPSYHTYIIQKYIERPLLIQRRKFDIRCFGMLTCINGHIQGYYYGEGYVRTASSEYSLENHSKYIHLTNDAIQKHSDNYGKFESGNKLSYSELGSYFANLDLLHNLLPQIKEIVALTFEAVHDCIDMARRQHCFELFGYDFMVDEDSKAWLIEVNTNPCLEESCPLLTKLLTELIDNTFRITLDPLFPPPPSRSKNLLSWIDEFGVNNKFQLVFSESELTRQQRIR